MPVPAEQTPTGTILVKTQENHLDCVVYARVSSNDQKPDLDRIVARIVEAVTLKGLRVSKTGAYFCSGLNGHRPKLKRLLSDSSVKIIAVEHKDRLRRFGYEYIESALQSQGRHLIVIDKSGIKNDLVEDMISVLTSFCARLYGRRAAKNKTKKALEVIKNGSDTQP